MGVISFFAKYSGKSEDKKTKLKKWSLEAKRSQIADRIRGGLGDTEKKKGSKNVLVFEGGEAKVLIYYGNSLLFSIDEEGKQVEGGIWNLGKISKSEAIEICKQMADDIEKGNADEIIKAHYEKSEKAMKDRRSGKKPANSAAEAVAAAQKA